MASPDTIFFLQCKKTQGHVLDQMAQNGPPGNTPKKGSLSRKRPKEDERVGRGHFHERVGESPGQDENFGANAFTKSRFVPEIRPFEKKRAGINNSVYSKSWLLLTAHFGPVFIVPSQWSISAVSIDLAVALFPRSEA